jgi:hypothetical protein
MNEQETVTVPRFIADYINESRHFQNIFVILDEAPIEVMEWFYKNDKKAIKAYLYGYKIKEVEK